MAVKSKDYYEVLGVGRKATPAEIKAAYRKLARKHHPDLNAGNKGAEERFKEIQAAYDVLGEPGKRKKYDQYGENWQRVGEGFAPPPGWETFGRAGGRPGREGRGFAGFDFDFGLGGGLEGLFEELRSRGGHAGRAGRTRPRPGPDAEAELELALEEAYRGARKTLQAATSETCPTCKGSGVAVGGEVCPRCGGDGLIRATRRIEVNIPAGARDGATMRLRGQGGAGTADGPSGDLYLHIRLQPDPVFTVIGDDIEVTSRIAPWEAVLGARVEVPTIDGTVELTIPPGSQDGQRLRLRGRGLSRRRGGRGDQYVKLAIAVPERVSEEERQLYEQLRRVSRFNPREPAR